MKDVGFRGERLLIDFAFACDIKVKLLLAQTNILVTFPHQHYVRTIFTPVLSIITNPCCSEYFHLCLFHLWRKYKKNDLLWPKIVENTRCLPAAEAISAVP